jgi:hypothetical protein
VAGSSVAGSGKAGGQIACSHGTSSHTDGAGGTGSNGIAPHTAAAGSTSAISGSGDLRTASAEDDPNVTSSARACHAAHAAAVLP